MIEILSPLLDEGDYFNTAEITADFAKDLFVLTAYGMKSDNTALTGYLILEKNGSGLFVPSEKEVHSCNSHCDDNCSLITNAHNEPQGCQCAGAPANGFCNHKVVWIEESGE
jgi:hypothetical protein